LQSRQLRPQGIRTTNFVKIGPAAPEMCSRTDRHTDVQTN